MSKLKTTGIFPGWYVVAAVFVLLMVNAGLGFYGLSVFLEALTEEQPFTTAQVSLATSIFFIVSAVAGRLIAPVLQQRDIRIVVAIGGVIAAAGLLLIGRSTNLVALYASYIVFAAGTGLCGLVPGSTLVTRWFQARRSVALSIASTGLSVGGITVTAAAALLIDRKGMPGASPWLALMYVGLVAVALPWLFPDPESRGLVPDGKAPAKDVPATPSESLSYEDAVSSRFFRLVTFGFVFAMGSQVGGIAHLFKLGEETSEGSGAVLVSALALTSVVARLIGGVVASRVSLIALTAVLCGVQSLSLVWLSQGASRAALVAAAILFGSTIGNLLMLQPLVIADQFGVGNYARLFSLSQLIVVGLGVAGGPYLLGWLHDLRSYTTSYVAAAALSGIGTVVFFIAWRFDGAKSSFT